MRIVILTSSLSAGGAERVASTLSNSWVERGDTVTLIPTFSGGGAPFYPLAPDVELVYLASRVQSGGSRMFAYGRRLAALRRLIAERQPDVVISFLPNVNVAAILSTAGMRLPVIICERSDPSQQPYTWFWKVACRLTYRFADLLTVQTLAVEKKAGVIFPGVKRIRTVVNPLPAEVLKHKYTGGGSRRVLLSLGRLSAEKQVHRIIDAFSKVCHGFPEWDLHIHGDGPLRDELEAMIIEGGLQQRVLLKGRTSEPWKVMAGADAFVMASLYEGFPNALLEAMGIGLPCIAFDCPSGPREISNDGKEAILVPLNDQDGLRAAMETVMSGQTSAAGMDARRNSVVARFGIDAVLGRWDDLFTEVGVSR